MVINTFLFHFNFYGVVRFIYILLNICLHCFVMWKLARQFGYKQSPAPFLALEKNQYSFKKNILRGVNFASGGAGILRDTGSSQWVITN